MSTQRERFQAAFRAKWPYRHPNDSTWAEYETFKLGEASGLERAAKVCDAAEMQHLNARDIDDFYSSSSACAAACESCATEIRALMARRE